MANSFTPGNGLTWTCDAGTGTLRRTPRFQLPQEIPQGAWTLTIVAIGAQEQCGRAVLAVAGTEYPIDLGGGIRHVAIPIAQPQGRTLELEIEARTDQWTIGATLCLVCLLIVEGA